MQVENSFSVNAPLEQVWTYLLDVQSLAPCVPGAELTEVVSDTEYKGTVTVKVGAVKMSYKGTLSIDEVDEANHRVVLTARGSETRGSGAAGGTVTSTVIQDGNKTTVNLVSEITVTGRVAQFGRNIIQDVSNRLIKDFASCLEAHLREGDTVDSEPSAAEAVAGSAGSNSGSESSPGPSEVEKQPGTDNGGPASTQDEPPKASDTRSPETQPAAEIKVLPIIVEVTRSRMAKGLRNFAKALDPNKE